MTEFIHSGPPSDDFSSLEENFVNRPIQATILTYYPNTKEAVVAVGSKYVNAESNDYLKSKGRHFLFFRIPPKMIKQSLSSSMPQLIIKVAETVFLKIKRGRFGLELASISAREDTQVALFLERPTRTGRSQMWSIDPGFVSPHKKGDKCTSSTLEKFQASTPNRGFFRRNFSQEITCSTLDDGEFMVNLNFFPEGCATELINHYFDGQNYKLKFKRPDKRNWTAYDVNPADA